MHAFSVAHSVSPHWEDAVDECLTQFANALPAATLGFVYVTDTFAEQLPSLYGWLTEQTPQIQWVGTVGIGVCVSGREFHNEPAIVMMICALPPDCFRTFATAADRVSQTVANYRQWLQHVPMPLALVHGDPNQNDIAALIEDFSEAMGGAFLVGGVASSRGSYLQIAGSTTDLPLSGVMFDNAISVSTRLSQGCLPLGFRHEVTACDENYIFTLDDAPALDVLKADIGEELASEIERIGGHIFAGLPIRGSDTGDYLVRNIIGIEPNQGIVVIGDRVIEGDSLLFCRRDPDSAYQDLIRMLKDIRPQKPPLGAVYFSCLARGPAQFGPGSRELQAIAAIIGEIPVVGCFCNGEISHNRLYGYTGILTLFNA